MTRGTRIGSSGGFSFIEVLMALGMLLVGSVSILALFAMGTEHLVQRKIDGQIDQVRRETWVLLQDAFDGESSGGLPDAIAGRALSEPDFTLDATFRPSPFGGDRAVALAVVKYQGSPVRAFPVPLTRSILVPSTN